MIKKMMLLAVSAAAVVAFAVPATASAQQIVENGNPLEVGDLFTATSTNTETKTASGTLNCSKVTLHLEVLENSPELSIAAGEGTTENCSITENGAPVVITSVNVEEVALFPGGEGEASFVFVSDIAGLLKCTFSGTVPVTYTSTNLHVEGALSATGEGCPPGGSISGDFSIETADGTPLEIS